MPKRCDICGEGPHDPCPVLMAEIEAGIEEGIALGLMIRLPDGQIQLTELGWKAKGGTPTQQ